MTYTIEIPQLEDLQKAFERAPKTVTREVVRAGNRALVRYQATARQGAPVDKGQLRSSIMVSPMYDWGDRIEGAVGTGVRHAIYQEQGTGIYGPAKRPIRPTTKPVLAWQKNGQWHFAKQVKGVRPKWFMKTSVEKNKEATINDFDRALNNVTKQLARSKTS